MNNIKHNIYFYKNKKGEEPVRNYLKKLKKKNDKYSKRKLRKIQDYINILSINGISAGEPYIKHVDGDIWELRPLRDRIFFVVWKNNNFIFLHQFMKKTQKIPKREIKQAQKEYMDFQKRGFYIE